MVAVSVRPGMATTWCLLDDGAAGSDAQAAAARRAVMAPSARDIRVERAKRMGRLLRIEWTDEAREIPLSLPFTTHDATDLEHACQRGVPGVAVRTTSR